MFATKSRSATDKFSLQTKYITHCACVVVSKTFFFTVFLLFKPSFTLLWKRKLGTTTLRQILLFSVVPFLEIRKQEESGRSKNSNKLDGQLSWITPWVSISYIRRIVISIACWRKCHLILKQGSKSIHMIKISPALYEIDNSFKKFLELAPSNLKIEHTDSASDWNEK